MTFGESAPLFNLIRRNQYAPEVMEAIVAVLGTPAGQHVIDLGCGTGIATRILAARGYSVVGVDADNDMIEEASSLGDAAGYRVMSAQRLAFPDGSFHSATAFSSFHWFCDDASVSEIRRILRSGGCFVVVNKTDRGPFRQAMVEIARRYALLKLAEPRAGYRPAEILLRGGFSGIEECLLDSVERLTLETAVQYVRSTRFWGEVPGTFHGPVEDAIRDYVTSRLDASGHFCRPVTTTIVTGGK